jgi:ADP-heptose:LPS heptosyltransferase/glycosyltransferase involved in cell wall biosynthesis
MSVRVLVCFPTSESLGVRAGAAQLALGLAARGDEVIVFGASGPWRHPLRAAGILAVDLPWPPNERKLAHALHEYDPQVIHVFGAFIAHQVLPLAPAINAAGVATLGHEDLSRIIPAHFRTASAVFVPCEYLREQVARRLPAIPVITTGYLLSPDDGTYIPRNRFLAEELGVEEDAPVLLMADRYDGSDGDVARTLIEAMPLINERLPDLQAVIVGDGLRLAELEGLAMEVNDGLRRRAVLLPGYREDIRQLLSLATIAIGSGRFAMEAIGAGVALVAAGAAGMIGTYTPDNAQVATFTCCGKHGRLDPISPKALASEVIGLFAYPQYRERFAAEDQAAVLAQTERTVRTAQIAKYYRRTSSTGVMARTPQHLTVILPDDLRSLLFSLPAVSAVRHQYPLAHLSIVAAAPHSRLVEAFDLAQSVLWKPRNLREVSPVLKKLSKPRAEAVVNFGDAMLDHVIAAATRAHHRVGFAESAGAILLSDPIHARVEDSPQRAVLLAHPLGVSAAAEVSAPTLPPHVRDLMDLGLVSLGIEPHDHFILLALPADESRAWLPSSWETLAMLLEERPERVVVLDDRGIALPGALEAVPLEDSLMLAALISRASLVVGPDGAPLHLASLLGVPTVGLYGPTSPDTCALPSAQNHSLCHCDMACHPCNANTCPERRCMRALTPAEVATAVERALTAAR